MEAKPPKTETPKLKRRWYQFSLRTLMIVVTLLAVPLGYVGWQAKIVHERQAAFANLTPVLFSSWRYMAEFAHGDPARGPSFIRRLAGDRAEDVIYVTLETPLEERQRLADLFPEATIYKETKLDRFRAAREKSWTDEAKRP